MMNTKTMRKAARDLVPGDVLVFASWRHVVVYVAETEGRGIMMSHAVLALDEPLKITRYARDAQFTVEIPAGLTPVQAAADKLLVYARMFREVLDPRDPTAVQVQGLLDELDPPKPPTLEEAMDVVRRLLPAAREDSPSDADAYFKAVADAEKLLKRVPS